MLTTTTRDARSSAARVFVALALTLFGLAACSSDGSDLESATGQSIVTDSSTTSVDSTDFSTVSSPVTGNAETEESGDARAVGEVDGSPGDSESDSGDGTSSTTVVNDSSSAPDTSGPAQSSSSSTAQSSPATSATSESSATTAPTTTRPTSTTTRPRSSTASSSVASSSTAPATDAPVSAASNSSPRVDLPPEVGGTEGVAADGTTGRIFVGDLTNGDVWVGKLDGQPFTRFSSGGAAGRTNTLGLAIDEARRRLYVVANVQNRVDVLNADTGAQVASIPIGGAGTINDVTVAPDGTVYVSDMGAPRVFRIGVGSTTSELWADYGSSGVVDTARSLHGNGIVADGGHVLVAYMETGELLRFDRSTGAVSRVGHSGSGITGRDGLVLCGNTLVGVDNSSFAGGRDALWVSTLSGDRSTSTHRRVEQPSTLSVPSTAALLGSEIVVVNAQFGVNPTSRPFWLTVSDSPC